MTDQPLFDLDPLTHARTGDPDTSHTAAVRLSDKRTMMRTLLVAFNRRPLTSEEAADICGYDASSGAWKRVSDLHQLGLIEDTGLRRVGRSGRAQMVRRITGDGRAAL